MQLYDWNVKETILDVDGYASFEKEYMPKLVLQFTYYYIFEKWCSDHYPDVDRTRCLATFLNFKVNANNRLGHWRQAEAHHYDKESQRDLWDKVYTLIAYTGLFCFLFKIQVTSSKNLPLFFLFLNLAVQIWRFIPLNGEYRQPSWWKVSDVPAYLTQGKEFWRGQTNYTLIGGLMGPCFYPAGHLWLYAIIDKYIFSTFVHCEMIFEIFNIMVQTCSLYIIISLARRYFNAEPSRAQIIGFLIVSNQSLHELYQNLYNETFQEFFVLSAIFCLVALNRPIVAAVILSLAISLKALAILLLPGMLGWIQYKHGTVSLLASIQVIVAIQFILAAPFVSQTAATMMGWPGANSTPYQYLTHSKFLPSHHKRKRRGAVASHSQIWNFISEELFLKGAWLELLQKIIMGVNVYYFFIRRNCLPQCLR